ncbi:extracellular matrix protein 2 isoform X2 [Nyctibius grandis]|uniref:extracellular matrix protein 2 isoform X2 n=1 Tax=Nyctibius grandis TaxID=48427 RepID=UPI0035BB9F1C
MQATSVVYYFLLVSLCIDFSQNETSALLGRQRRRTRYRGLRRSSSAGHRSSRQPRMKLPAPIAVVPSIPLINIDDGVMGVFDSLIGLGGHESSYSVLPGKKGQCTANGMIMYDKAVWSPKPCITCLCSKGEVLCDTTMCHPLKCPNTIIPAGECCPVCSDTASSLDSSIISLDDISELSGDSPEPNDLDNTHVLPSARIQTEKDELLRTEVVEFKEKEGRKKDEKKRKRKGKKNRQKHKAYHREKKPIMRKAAAEEEIQYESDEDDGAFRMPSHFPIPVPPIEAPPLPSGCSTSDTTVSCINAKLTQIPPISDPDLTSLDLTGNSITTIADEAFNGIPNLEWIDLSKNNITSPGIGPQAFKILKKLKRLYLDGNMLVHIPSELPSTLEEIKINDNHLHAIDEDGLQDLKNLVTLELEGNKLSEANVSPLAFYPLKSLSYLRLGRNKFRIIPQGLPATLEELYLENNQIEEVSEICFNHTRNINVIVLKHNKLEEHRIAPLAWINQETVPPERICRTHTSDDDVHENSDEEENEESRLEHVHLENNYINTRQLSPHAFSCIRSYCSVVLKPQKIK